MVQDEMFRKCLFKMKKIIENIYILWLAFCKLIGMVFIAFVFILGLFVIWCWLGNTIDWGMLPRLGG